MSPEQQAEHNRREQRKAYITNCATNVVMQLVALLPDLRADDMAARAWNIAEAMSEQREKRGHEH